MARSTYFTITLKGVKEAQDYLKKQAQRLNDVRNALARIAQDFYRVEREWFDSQGGGRWRPLSPRYAQRKAKFFPGKKILRRTDKMYREFTGQTRHFKVTRHALDINVLGVRYWLAHEEGAGRMPQREVISPWVAQRVDTWHQMVTDHISVNIRTGNR